MKELMKRMYRDRADEMQEEWESVFFPHAIPKWVEAIAVHDSTLVGDAPQHPYTALDWYGEGFSPQEASEWIGSGCWEPVVAKALQQRGLSPKDMRALPRCMQAALYECCNGDMGVGDLIRMIESG